MVCLVGHAGLSGVALDSGPSRCRRQLLLPDRNQYVLEVHCVAEENVQVTMQTNSTMATGKSHPGSKVTFIGRSRVLEVEQTLDLVQA